MNTLPRRASALLHACGVNPSVIGDLEEAAQAGRSRSWCWRQVAGVLLLGPAPPVAVGWAMLLISFVLFTTLAAGPLLTMARQTGQWTTVEAATLLGGYCAFGLLTRVVSRSSHHAPALVVGATRLALFTLLGMMVLQLFRAAAVFAEIL